MEYLTVDPGHQDREEVEKKVAGLEGG